MVLKLDPRYPVVWRTPTSLQIGVADPIAVLDDLTPATERMIAALVPGVSRSGLSMIGKTSGATEDEVVALVDRLDDAFFHAVEPGIAPTVLVVGTGLTSERVAEALAWNGIRVRIAHDEAAAVREDCSLAIIVAHFVVAPVFHGTWLRRDIPHLPVVISDTTVTIGPLVEPGRGPCLYCLLRFRSDADPAWPAIATQLHGKRSQADTPLVAGEAAATVSRIVQAFLTDPQSLVDPPSFVDPQSGGFTAALSLDVDSGATSAQSVLPHPLCGCRGLGTDPASAAAQPGSGSAGAGPHAVVRLHPTTATASSAPG